MFNAVYPKALDCGIGAIEFWDMSMAEIEEALDSHRRTMQQREKIRIERLFVLADAIGNRVSSLFNDKGKVELLQPWHLYPELFTEEQRYTERQEKEVELREYIEARKKHADDYNRKRREAEINEC